MGVEILVGIIWLDRVLWAALAGVIIITVGVWGQYLASVGDLTAQGR